MRIFLACCCFFVFSTLILNNAYAKDALTMPKVEESQVDEAILHTSPIRFTPDNPLHYLIRAKETFSHLFKPSASKKAEYDLILIGKRLTEIRSLTRMNKLDKVSDSFDLYSDLNDRLRREIERARSQNQDIADFLGTFRRDLIFHEILLSDIYSSVDSSQDPNIGSSFISAYAQFEKSAYYLDSLIPGSLREFKSISEAEHDENMSEVDEKNESTQSPYFPYSSPYRIVR